MNGNLTESRAGVIAEAAVVLAEVAKAEAVQVMLVRGVTERAVVSVVRGFNMDPAAGLDQPVKLFHGLDDIGHMFDHVDGAQTIETVGFERVREAVQIGQNVGAGVGVIVQSNGAGELVYAATYVKYQVNS